MEELWSRLARYAAAYLPAWRWDPADGTPESALLAAWAELLADTEARTARLGEKHETEFLNAWAPEALPAAPASAAAALRARGAGALIPAGTAFYAGGDGTRVWRTCGSIWAGEAAPTAQAFTCAVGGKIVLSPLPEPGAPTRLYDFSGPGAQTRAARFAHPDAFCSADGCEAVLLPDAPEALCRALADGARVEWRLVGDGAAYPVAPPRRGDAGALCFALPPMAKARALEVRGLPDAALPSDTLRGARVRTLRGPCPPERVVPPEPDGDAAAFLPFGEEPAPRRACYLACDEALSQRGAMVEASFTLSCRDTARGLPDAAAEAALRPVLRRLPEEPAPPRDVRVERTAWEYWNGAAWLPIDGTAAYAALFEGAREAPARVRVQFLMPRDAAACALFGETHFWLRLRVLRAENAGWRPCVFHAPLILGLRFAASTGDAPQAVAVSRRAGLEAGFSELSGGALFPPAEVDGEAWWLGFSAPPGGAPFTLRLELVDNPGRGALTAEEAEPDGTLRPVALRDGTDGLSHTGVLTLAAPPGAAATVRFGRRLWWLCLRTEGGGATPVLRAADAGAVTLRAEGDDACAPGETLRPLRGGAVLARSLTASFGGAPSEPREALLERTRAARRQRGRAVSGEDLEALVCGAFREVRRVKCVRREALLQVAVLLRAPGCHAEAFGARREEIEALLLRESALPALGLTVALCPPRFYPLRVGARLCPPAGMPPQEAALAARRALDRFLDPVAGGFSGEGWPLGELPGAAQLAACLCGALPGAGVRGLLAAVTLPDGSEREPQTLADPFAAPLPGAYAITLDESGGAG